MLRLYRDLLRAGRSYPEYNIRKYIERVVKDDFRDHALTKDKAAVDQLITKAEEELSVIRRMSMVQSMYGGGRKNVLERM